MKATTNLLIVIACMLSVSCNYEEMFAKLVPEEESQFAEDYLKHLKNNNFDYVKQYIDPSIQSQVSDEKLLEIAKYFPVGEAINTELISARVNKFNSQWQGNFTFEYQFSSGWVLANVALKKSDEKLSVIGFNVYRTKASQRELNKFSFVGKSAFQYTVLAIAMVTPIFILVTTFYCIRTPIPKRKRVWILFILFGIGSISVNWTTGQYGIQLTAVPLTFDEFG